MAQLVECCVRDAEVVGSSPATPTEKAITASSVIAFFRFPPDAIEAQLGHRVPDRLGGAYNRTKHLEERTRMMQDWVDYLDGLK